MIGLCEPDRGPVNQGAGKLMYGLTSPKTCWILYFISLIIGIILGVVKNIYLKKSEI